MAFRESFDICQNILRELLKTFSSNSSAIHPSPTWITARSGSGDEQVSGVLARIVQASLARAAQSSDNLFYAEVFKTISRAALKGHSDESSSEAWIDMVLSSDGNGKL
jgi:hypothetical protein